MYAAIHLPRFALQAALRARPQAPRTPCAVMDALESSLEKTKADQQRLLHVNTQAERHGVHAGMAAGMAMARCARLLLLHRDPDAEQVSQGEVLECAAQWTPDYETTAAGLCVLDVSRIRGLAGQWQACGQSMHEQLATQRLHARIGFAPNADLAVLAAYAARPVLVWPSAQMDGASVLQSLPLHTLSPLPDTAELLRLWGIRTLGDFMRLPRQEVVLRLGSEGSRLWDMAAGGRERLLRLFRPASRYQFGMDLEHPVESLEPLLFLMRRILDTLCCRLAENWMAASSIKLELAFDDKKDHEATLRIAEPTRDIELLLRLLHTHLDGITAPAPIVRLALELTPVRPSGCQMHIFERGMPDPNRFAETLAQVEAIVDHGNAGRIKLTPSRALDAFKVVSFLDEQRAAQNHLPSFGRKSEKAAEQLSAAHHVGLPLRRFRPSQCVEVTLHDGRPDALHLRARSHFITRCSGPWLVSGDWWAEARWQREVWEVETSEGALYQLTRHNGQWQLEGVFG